MRVGDTVGRIGAWMVLAVMPCGAYALAQVALWQWRSWPLVWDVDDALTLVAAALGAAVAAYLTLSAVVMVVAAATRRGRTIPARARALAPVAWQRVTAVALGIGLSSGVAVPAFASTQSPPGLGWADAPAVTEQAADAPAVGLGATDTAAATNTAAATATDTAVNVRLEWSVPPVSAESPQAMPATEAPVAELPVAEPPAREPASGTYVVRPGDSLWGITESLLGDHATDADINATWPVLFEANRDAIGNDPSLIFAGTELHVPAELAR